MNIDKMKTEMIAGPEDGQSIAFIKNNTAYIVQADGMSDALDRMANMGFGDTNEWMLSNEKAVFVPGVWEFEMAMYIGDMTNDQIVTLGNELAS